MCMGVGTYVRPCVLGGGGALCLIQKPGNDRMPSFFIIVAHKAPATREEVLSVRIPLLFYVSLFSIYLQALNF